MKRTTIFTIALALLMPLIAFAQAGGGRYTEDCFLIGNQGDTYICRDAANKLVFSERGTSTSTSNFSSETSGWRGSFFNASSVATFDYWTIQDVIGTGTTPTSTLTFAHSGSSGTASISAPSLNVTSASGFQVNGLSQIYSVASDFTDASSTALQTITGLTWTLPANTAQNVPFSCHLMYAQATAAVADQFGIQSASLAPTNIAAKAQAYISASTLTAGNMPTLTTTTATPIVTFTPSAITTVWNADIDGFIENPSGVATAINIMVQQSTAGDLITIKRGSFCRIF